jgi:hypothetical protein
LRQTKIGQIFVWHSGRDIGWGGRELISTIDGGCATLDNSADLDGKKLRIQDVN